ncbi:MAG: sigma-E processing peptidase SpoIIGA [Eubacteriales bacterium]
MYYELYVDILCLVNFMMDYLALLIVREITRNASSHIRIFLASLVGAILTCIVIIIPISYASIKFILFHIVINTVMIHIGFKIKSRKQFVMMYISLYVACLLLGGVLQYFQQYMKISSLFFAMAVCSYWIVRGVWYFIQFILQYRSKWYDVELYVDTMVIQTQALLDTGNSLKDTYTNQPISIVSKKLIKNINILSENKNLRYIPYHSLGNYGVMCVITIDKIHICGEREYWIEKPRIAISDDAISNDESYQMILNPDIL